VEKWPTTGFGYIRRPFLQLWNTRTRTKDDFNAPEIVQIYVCGITPYATTHLGHARTYLLFDVLIREIEHLGHTVRYAQNVTDVDDPLFERAKQLGMSSAALARESTRAFQDDLAALRVRPPDYYPRASDEVPEIQELIGALLEGGHAYRRGDRVYYRVRSFPSYGSFSRLERSQMIDSARDHGEDPSDPAKEDPLDFILWKSSQLGEASWASPWGQGRPGWHIECSAMALTYLTPTLDIHGGGSDLIFPHHENEIAQSEAGTGQSPFARFWMHVEMVSLGGVKMSKSLGNLVLVRELRRRVNPLAIRHYLLCTHYRSWLDYSEPGLQASVERVRRLDRALARTDARVDPNLLADLAARFDAALADDLDTPAALAVLDEAAELVLAAPTAAAPTGDWTLRDLAARLGFADERISPVPEPTKG
jgi:L-cysteine:1D-myo-inositol 2-amino-2-deoxy-alpha-D-glucopyranoside ligase